MTIMQQLFPVEWESKASFDLVHATIAIKVVNGQRMMMNHDPLPSLLDCIHCTMSVYFNSIQFILFYPISVYLIFFIIQRTKVHLDHRIFIFIFTVIKEEGEG